MCNFGCAFNPVFNECGEKHDLGIFYTCLDWLQCKFDIISFGPNHLIHIGHACAFRPARCNHSVFRVVSIQLQGNVLIREPKA